MEYPAAVPPEHVVGYEPAGDDDVYVVEHVSLVRETPLTDGEPVIVGAVAPTVTVCDDAVTASGMPALRPARIVKPSPVVPAIVRARMKHSIRPSDATFPYIVLVTVTVCCNPNDVHPELVPFHVLLSDPREPHVAS
jgi:hypothetical protein